MSNFKYKVFYNGSLCKVYNDDCKYILNMFKSDVEGIPVETGGELELPNGDTLYINEKMGPCWGGEYEGIELSLDSGNEFVVWYYMDSIDRWQESGFGCIYDYDEEDMYAEGNFMRIYYDLDGADMYDWHYGSFWYNERYGHDLGFPFITLVLQDDMWIQVDNNPIYDGNTVTLNSGEEIWVSNRWGSQSEGSIICFSRDSGYGCFAYLKYDGDVINHTSNFWLGLNCDLDDNTSITIYDYGDDDYQSAIDYSEDYSEENVSEYLNKLCVLYYNASTNEWYVDEDYS